MLQPLTEDAVAKSPKVENPKPQRPLTVGIDSALESFLNGTQPDRLALVMVGLPGRGKTYIARRLERYLTFFHGAPTKIFNIAEYRRELYGATDHTFFDQSKDGTAEKLKESALRAIEDMKTFLTDQTNLGHIGIYDGHNTSRDRRQWILDQLEPTHTKVIFIESICDDDVIINENIRKTKFGSPDYTDTEEEEAANDFKKRIEHFAHSYEPIDARYEDMPYVKIFDGGVKVEIKGIHGYIPSKIVQFLMNVRFSGQSNFFLSRHGQSEYNQMGKIGGDSDLSEKGRRYAEKFAEFCEGVVCRDENGNIRRARLWTSSMRRTIQTASLVPHPQLSPTWINMMPRVWRGIDEIYAGICDGMTYDEIKKQFPLEYEARKKNKLTYRYPRGESYVDLIARLEPLIHEMERIKEPLVIVGHQAVLRLLYCYFKGLPREQAPTVPFPLHTVIQMQLDTYTCETQTFPLMPDEELADSEPPSH